MTEKTRRSRSPARQRQSATPPRGQVYRTIVVLDIERFGHPARDDTDRVGLREGLLDSLSGTFARRIGRKHWSATSTGDGLLVLVDPAVPTAKVLRALVDRLSLELAKRNGSTPGISRLRARAVVHAGNITLDRQGPVGEQVNLAFRLLDAETLRAHLAAMEEPLVLGVSDYVYQQVVRQRALGLNPKAFVRLPVAVKETNAEVWVHTSGRAGEPRLSEKAGDAAGWLQGGLDGTAAAWGVGVPPVGVPVIDRNDLFERACSMVVGARQGPLVALVGMGGSGKTMLAGRVAREPAVRSVFPDGVFWIELGRNPNLVSAQAWLLERLGAEPRPVRSVDDGRHRLERVMRDRACLLVIDNVWQARHLAAFLVDVPGSALLVTARDRRVVPPSTPACVADVELFTERQAMELLAKWTGQPVRQLPPAAVEVLEACGRLPLAVAVAGGLARRDLNRWDGVLAKLNRADLGKLKVIFGRDYAHPSVLAALSASFTDLSEAQQCCYRELAAFDGRGPIPEAALIRLWHAHGLDAETTRDLLAEFADSSLLSRDPVTGAVSLHDLLLDYAAHALAAGGPGAVTTVHARIAGGYLDLWGGLAGRLPALRDRSQLTDDDRYGLAYLVDHLIEADNGEQVHRLLTVARPSSFFGQAANIWWTAHERSGSTAGYLTDLDKALALAEQATDTMLAGEQPAPSIGREVRYALVASSISSRAATLSEELLVALVQHGRWPPGQAVAYAKRIPERGERAVALARLLRYLDPPENDLVGASLLAIVPELPEPARAEVLVAVAPSRPDAALAAAGDLDEPFRVEVLMAVAPHLPDAVMIEAKRLSERAMADVLVMMARFRPDVVLLAARELDEPLRAEVLVAVAPFLPERVLAEAGGLSGRAMADVLVTMARFRPDAVLLAAGDLNEPLRVEVLTAVAPYLPKDGHDRVLDEAAATMSRLPCDATLLPLLVSLAPYRPHAALSAARDLPILERSLVLIEVAVCGFEVVREDMIDQALAAASRIAHLRSRARLLTAIAPYRPDTVLVASELLSGRALVDVLVAVAPYRPHAVLAAAGDLPESVQAEVLMAVLLHLPDAQRGRLTNESLLAARTLIPLLGRGLVGIVPHVPEALRGLLLEEALSSVSRLDDRLAQANVLVALAPYRPAAILDVAYELGDQEVLARVLLAVVPHVPESDGRRLLDEALANAVRVDNPMAQAELLVLLAQQRPDEVVAVLAAADRLSNHERVQVLAAVAPQLPKARRREVLEGALHLAEGLSDAMARAEALVELARFRPAAVLAAADRLSGHERAQVLLAVVPHLPRRRRRRLLDQAQRISEGLDDPMARAAVLVRLAPYEPEAVLAAAAKMTDASALGLVLPAVAHCRAEEALAGANRARDPEVLVRVLTAVARHRPEGPRRQQLLDQALACMPAIDKRWARADALDLLVQSDYTAATSAWAEHWRRLLTTPGARLRSELLAEVASMVPVLFAAGGMAAIDEVVEAVRDVLRWWP